MRLSVVVACAALVMLFAGATSAFAVRWPHILIMVTGPAGSDPPEDLVLEVGATAWSGYGGVVAVPSDAATPVRLVGAPSCRTYAGFFAPPGSAWVITFKADGSVGVEDSTGRAMELGPALVERAPSGCPAGAGGSDRSADPGQHEVWVVAAAALVVLAVSLLAFVRLDRARA